MILNYVMALILRYFAEFGIAFGAHYVKWLISRQQILSREMTKVHRLNTTDALCSSR